MKIEDIYLGEKFKIISGRATEINFGWGNGMSSYIYTIQEAACFDLGRNGMKGVRFKNILRWIWHPDDLILGDTSEQNDIKSLIQPVLFTEEMIGV